MTTTRVTATPVLPVGPFLGYLVDLAPNEWVTQAPAWWAALYYAIGQHRQHRPWWHRCRAACVSDWIRIIAEQHGQLFPAWMADVKEAQYPPPPRGPEGPKA